MWPMAACQLLKMNIELTYVNTKTQNLNVNLPTVSHHWYPITEMNYDQLYDKYIVSLHFPQLLDCVIMTVQWTSCWFFFVYVIIIYVVRMERWHVQLLV